MVNFDHNLSHTPTPRYFPSYQLNLCFVSLLKKSKKKKSAHVHTPHTHTNHTHTPPPPISSLKCSTYHRHQFEGIKNLTRTKNPTISLLIINLKTPNVVSQTYSHIHVFSCFISDSKEIELLKFLHDL